jgi:hypothetical protein
MEDVALIALQNGPPVKVWRPASENILYLQGQQHNGREKSWSP